MSILIYFSSLHPQVSGCDACEHNNTLGIVQIYIAEIVDFRDINLEF